MLAADAPLPAHVQHPENDQDGGVEGQVLHVRAGAQGSAGALGSDDFDDLDLQTARAG
jgi:hypothetical protein